MTVAVGLHLTFYKDNKFMAKCSRDSLLAETHLLQADLWKETLSPPDPKLSEDNGKAIGFQGP